MNNTILLGLNEINFDFVKFYTDKNLLPNFKKLLDNNNLYLTASEKEYKLLEPWIQWVTVYTGKEFAEHQIYRLGDIVGSEHLEQIFEKLEDKDFSVMAVSPFNVENRLKKSKLFIPDPWTKTKVNGNWIVKAIYNAVHQTVNQNASGNFKFSSLLSLLIAFILTVPFKRFLHYMNLILKFKKPGIKAVILDSLLADVFLRYQKKINPNFSNLFLNSGAHIQHHYLFNSSAYKGKFKNPEWYCPKNYDPLLIILKEYDRIIGELSNENNKLIIDRQNH